MVFQEKNHAGRSSRHRGEKESPGQEKGIFPSSSIEDQKSGPPRAVFEKEKL
jgi:hypothetical protein